VYDQYLNFVSLEPGLFSLRLPEAFLTLNSRASLESEVTQAADSIASGLLSVLVTLGWCSGGNAGHCSENALTLFCGAPSLTSP